MKLICKECGKDIGSLTMLQHYKLCHPSLKWPQDWQKVNDVDI